IVPNCTPCDESLTVSGSGHLVALMRLRKSVMSAAGNEKWNGRIAVASPVFCATPASVMALSLLGELSKPFVPAARVAAASPMKRRRVNLDGPDMESLLQLLATTSGAIETPCSRAATERAAALLVLPPRLCGRAKGPESLAHFGREDIRLLPRGEVAAL